MGNAPRELIECIKAVVGELLDQSGRVHVVRGVLTFIRLHGCSYAYTADLLINPGWQE